MFRNFATLLFFLAAIAIVDAAPVKEKKAQTIKGWGTVINPDHDCKVTQSEGKVTITVPNTYHDLNIYDSGTKVNAPRVLQEISGDFHVQVKVRVFPLPKPNTSSKGKDRDSIVSSGLLVWIDDKNFLYLQKKANGEMPSPFANITIEERHYFDGKIAGSTSYQSQKMNGPSGNRDTWLRIVRKNSILTFSFSADGEKWKCLDEMEVTLPQKVKVGVFATNTTTAQFAPTLEAFKVEKRKQCHAPKR